jgi:hypothetical protein
MTTSTAAPVLAAAPAHPPLRRLPLPRCEPPYDDEPGSGGWPARWLDGSPTPWRDGTSDDTSGGDAAVQGTLALAFVLPSGVPATPEAPPGLRVLGPGARPSRPVSDAQREQDCEDFGPQPTASSALPSARSWAGRVVQAIVEVLAGVRPAGQLVRWTTAAVYDEISHLVVAGRPDVAPPRGVVRSVHVSEPADGVAEVCALVRRGARSTAVALRLEGMDGRWQCTALELG